MALYGSLTRVAGSTKACAAITSQMDMADTSLKMAAITRVSISMASSMAKESMWMSKDATSVAYGKMTSLTTGPTKPEYEKSKNM